MTEGKPIPEENAREGYALREKLRELLGGRPFFCAVGDSRAGADVFATIESVDEIKRLLTLLLEHVDAVQIGHATEVTPDSRFTAAERARAAEIRAYAERPEAWRTPDTRCRVADHGAVIAGIQTCYAIARRPAGWARVITFTRADGGTPDARVCANIAKELFGFRSDLPVQDVSDPESDKVFGFAQAFQPAKESEG